MNRALEDMRERGMKIVPEDVEHLSPLDYDHINLSGRYTFSLPEDIRQGAFHPLRELEETEQEQEKFEIDPKAARDAWNFFHDPICKLARPMDEPAPCHFCLCITWPFEEF